MPRDNLLNSAALELLEHIKRENLKPLIIHLVERHRASLERITYVPTPAHILLHYDQLTGAAPRFSEGSADDGDEDNSALRRRNADHSFASSSEAEASDARRLPVISGGGGRWQGLRDADAEQDAYFDGSDGDEEEDEATAATVPLGAASTTSPVTAASPAKPLVDYGDDDDDEDDEGVGEGDGVGGKTSVSHDQAARPADQAQAQIPFPSRRNHPGSTQNSAAPTNPASSTTAAPNQPLVPLVEKRRRSLDDDADDALDRLAGTAKRRSSDVGRGSVSVSISGRSDGARQSMRASPAASASATSGGTTSVPIRPAADDDDDDDYDGSSSGGAEELERASEGTQDAAGKQVPRQPLRRKRSFDTISKARAESPASSPQASALPSAVPSSSPSTSTTTSTSASSASVAVGTASGVAQPPRKISISLSSKVRAGTGGKMDDAGKASGLGAAGKAMEAGDDAVGRSGEGHAKGDGKREGDDGETDER